VTRVVCPNGNPGIAREAETPAVDLRTNTQWRHYAMEVRPDLVVIGPEAPLADGLADVLRAAGFPVFGPGADGAQLEASKRWSKQLLLEAGIPTARAESFTDPEAAKRFADDLGLPVVVKADGLAAGKGVTVAATKAEAHAAIDENLHGARFGAASASVLVEEFMDGQEISLFALADGEHLLPLVPAQDHKRIFDNDQGPNTGGMGAYAPAPALSEELFSATWATILMPTLTALRARGIDYRGLLYAGLMLTPEGPKVVEFNCRFGDPETEAVLPLLDGDFAEVLLACAEGRLGPILRGRGPSLTIRPDHAATVVLASGGYPGEYPTGLPIAGLNAADGNPQAMIFHAGTRRGPDGTVLTAGGRVLACTAWESTLAHAVDSAYRLAESVSFTGRHFRRDIARRALHPQRSA